MSSRRRASNVVLAIYDFDASETQIGRDLTDRPYFQVGEILTTYIACKLKLAAIPDHANRGQIYGVAVCTGSALP